MLVEAVLEPSLGEKPAYVVLPFDAKAVFGKVRAPVVVSVGAYRFPAVIAAERGRQVLRFPREHREGAGVREGELVRLELELDEAPRALDVPADVGALLGDARLAAAWGSFPAPQQKRLLAYVGEVKGAEARRHRLAHLRERLEESAAARDKQKSALLARPKPPSPAEALRVAAPKVGAPKVGAPKVGAPKVGAPKVGAPKVGAPKAAAPKVGSGKLGARKVGAAKAGAAKQAQKAASALRDVPGARVGRAKSAAGRA
jgi:hypothetical protein